MSEVRNSHNPSDCSVLAHSDKTERIWLRYALPKFLASLGTSDTLRTLYEMAVSKYQRLIENGSL